MTIETDRADAKSLLWELTDIDLAGKPRLRELQEKLLAAEKRFQSAEYQGPG